MNGEVVGNQQLGLIVGMLFVWIGLFAISSILLAFITPSEDFESILALVASSLGKYWTDDRKLWPHRNMGRP